MQLSERGAIRSAIADGGLHLYPAGRLLDRICEELPGDELRGPFDPQRTAEKLSHVQGPSGGPARDLFQRDLALVRDRVAAMSPDYDIEGVFGRMADVLPALANRYYGVEGFEPVQPQVVEYFFEGYNDLYKDGDWFAFNVNAAESRELGVPIGTYFKRDQIAPGHPELTTLHEANHAMQEAVGLPEAFHHYIPWLDEGFADALGRIMLFRATEDEALLAKVKNFRTEVEVTDPRKVTYHYGEETAALILLRGRLPFFKALLRARKRDPFAIDWDAFARQIKSGVDPHVALLTAHGGAKRDAFRKKFEREETAFRKEGDLDQKDLRVLTMFLATQAPACLPAGEYAAALWLSEQVATERPDALVDPQAIPEGERGAVPDWNADRPLARSAIPEAVLKKSPAVAVKGLIPEEAIPQNLTEGVAALAAKYFVLKRQIGETVCYEPYGGGLPYRMRTGEIRCTF